MIAREEVAEDVGATATGLRSWLVSGAAQGATGAFTAWLDLATGLPSFDYPEITGYVLTYLASLPLLSPAEQIVGERAGGWLVGRLRRGNLAARDGWDNDSVYLFDLAMIATGLLTFGRRIGGERMLESGRSLVGLLSRAVDQDPTFSPVASDRPRSGRRAWSTHGRAHMAKLVQALLLVEDEPDGRAAALVDHVKGLQGDDGRIETGPEGETMLHPHLYAAEGLWIWGTAREDADALERARAAVEWAWGEQLSTGGFPRAAGGETPLEQSDVTAQALRLALALRVETADVDAAAARLVDLARTSGDGYAIVYQPAAPRAHVNTWATLFAAQALANAVPGAPPLAWQHLV